MFPCAYTHQRVDSFDSKRRLSLWLLESGNGKNVNSSSSGQVCKTTVQEFLLLFYGVRVACIFGKRFRGISTALLNALLHLHMRPIYQVVCLVPQGRSYLGNRLALRCFQRLSVPCLATRRYCGHNNRYTRGTSFPVLSY